MGSVRRAPRTGHWEARYRDPSGLQRTATFTRKADALAFLAVTETDKRRGEWLDPESSRITLREWHARWWPTVENSDRAPNTLVQYEGIVRVHVLPHLGDRRLATLRRIDVEEWLAALRARGARAVRHPDGPDPAGDDVVKRSRVQSAQDQPSCRGQAHAAWSQPCQAGADDPPSRGSRQQGWPVQGPGARVGVLWSTAERGVRPPAPAP